MRGFGPIQGRVALGQKRELPAVFEHDLLPRGLAALKARLYFLHPRAQPRRLRDPPVEFEQEPHGKRGSRLEFSPQTVRRAHSFGQRRRQANPLRFGCVRGPSQIGNLDMHASRLRLQARDDGAIFVDEHFQLRNARPREREASVGFVALKRQVAQPDLLRSQLNVKIACIHLESDQFLTLTRDFGRALSGKVLERQNPAGLSAQLHSVDRSVVFGGVQSGLETHQIDGVAPAQRVALGAGLSFRQWGLQACARNRQPPRAARYRGRREQSQKGGGQKPDQKENRQLYQGRLKPPSMRRTIARRRAEAKRGSPIGAQDRRTATFRMGSRSRGA